MRMPLVTKGVAGSKGIMFLFRVMPALSRVSSATLPVMPSLSSLTIMRWLSVPPDTRSKPFCMSLSARALAFFTTWNWYSLNSGVRASLKATALAAMACMNGPPWVPGKTDLSMAAASSSLHMIRAPLGPRRVL